MIVKVTKNTLLPSQMTSEEFFKALLPSIGEELDPLFKGPRWVPGLKGWVVNEYLNESGNYYYWLVRFCDNLLVIERDAIWGKGNITYLDDLAIWQFDGQNRRLIDSMKYDNTFRNEDHICEEIERMLTKQVKSQAKLYGNKVNDADVNKFCKECVEKSFKDFLDPDYEIRLMQILPMIEFKVND